MPLSILDFSKAQGTADWSGLRDAVKNYYAGKSGAVETAYQPQQIEAELAYKRAQSDPRLLEATIAEKMGNAAKARYWSPFTGAAGNLFALQQMEQGGNMDPESMNQIRKQIELEQDHERATTKYQQRVADSLYYGRMSPLQKKFADLDMIDQGKAIGMTGDVYDLTPEQRVQKRLATGKDIVNEITDPALRARVQFGNNMLTTFNSIDLDKAFARSGGWGTFKNNIEKGVGGLTGKQSDEFKGVQKELAKLQIVAKQASQFMDAPAAQAIQEGIQELADPNAWTMSPDAARQKFETFKQLMEQEHGNILRSVMSSEPYGVTFAQSGNRGAPGGLNPDDIMNQQGGMQMGGGMPQVMPQVMPQQGMPQPQQQQAPQMPGAGGSVMVRDPQGNPRRIPVEQLNAAIMAGGTLIG